MASNEPPVQFRRSWGRRLGCSADADPELVEGFWRRPGRMLDSGVPLKLGRRCTVVRIELGSRSWVVKRYNPRGFWHMAAHAFLPGRARHGWHYGRLLQCLGIRTPAPKLYVDELWGVWRTRSYLVTDYIPGMRLRRALRERRLDEAALLALGRQFSHLWERLDQARISHGDLKLANFLIDDENRLWLIDLDAARRHSRMASWKRARSRDRMRFLRDWSVTPEQWSCFAAGFETEIAVTDFPSTGRWKRAAA